MLSILVFLPLTGGLVLLLLPRRDRLLNAFAIVIALGALLVAGWLSITTLGGGNIEQRTAWVPAIGAEYALRLDGISAPLIFLTALLTLLALVYSAYSAESSPGETRKEYLFLFLLMETGLLGVFLASDMLLFYVFWEVALVPLYFIIGIWGHERRREAALKFFLYTRAGSLALLLAILALYLRTEPKSFSLSALEIAAQTADPFIAAMVLLGFALGFGVKLPIVPLHSWLPDAHVEAPTAGSVILAGLLLKMGGYGFIRIALPLVRDAFAHYWMVFVVIALVGVIYGAAVAMAQRDFKRLVAFTSINHMGFVLLGATVAALTVSEADRITALNGAVLQMVSHGLLTGGMFFLVGMLSERAGTRNLDELGGAWSKLPVFAVVLTVFAFGSFGLPSMSGFIAEFQVFVAALAASTWTAVLLAAGVAISTALYLRALQQVLFGEPPKALGNPGDLHTGDLVVLATLMALIFAIGLYPGPWITLIESGTRTLIR